MKITELKREKKLMKKKNNMANMIVVLLLSFVALTTGNSLTGNFKSCNIQCSNDGGDAISPPVSDKLLRRGKSGPRGEKGEPGESCPRIEQLQSRISQLTSTLTDANEVIHRNKFLLCGAGIMQTPWNDQIIKNSQLSASSYYRNDPGHAPYHGRLFGTTGRGLWAPNIMRANEWLQVDLETDKKIYGIVTQGRIEGNHRQWVTSYNVLYKTDGGSTQFIPITNNSGDAMVFQGNTDMNTPVSNSFPQPITARYFRINVLTWNRQIAVRFELLTC